jgi:transketolase
MARIRLHLGNLNIPELITLGQQVHFATYGNANFAALKPEVEGLLNEINEMIISNDGYQTALQLVQQRLAERQAQRASLEILLNKLAISVENISDGNPDLIRSAGFDVPATKAPSTSSRSSGQVAVGLERVAATN